MMAWADRGVRVALRTVLRAVRKANHEQVAMWESLLLVSRAAPATTAGPLRWVPSLDGYRLVGSYLSAED
jgi:hypothetical protein